MKHGEDAFIVLTSYDCSKLYISGSKLLFFLGDPSERGSSVVRVTNQKDDWSIITTTPLRGFRIDPKVCFSVSTLYFSNKEGRKLDILSILLHGIDDVDFSPNIARKIDLIARGIPALVNRGIWKLKEKERL